MWLESKAVDESGCGETDGVTRRARVETGYDDGRVVQILSGLSGDEEVVVSNKGNLADGQAVAASRVNER